jgi:IclR family acetate operon transcriptional repressor
VVRDVFSRIATAGPEKSGVVGNGVDIQLVDEHVSIRIIRIVKYPRNEASNPMTKTIETAFDIVETILELETAGVAELADEVNKPTSTVHDYLQGLEEIGCVVNENGTYRVGSRFLSIGTRMRSQLEIYKVAKPELQSLAATTGEHASLMIEENNHGVVLYTATGERAVQVDIHDGDISRLYTTAPGKAILANISPERTEEIIAGYELTARTPNTITEKSELFEELDEIREQGYALDREELFEGMHGVGRPIVVGDDVIGAISVYGPVGRIDESKITEKISDMVLETVNVIEVSLKY